MQYLDPINDYVFWRIFGKHSDLLKSFLNALMPFGENRQIVSLEYLTAEQVPENPAKENSIVKVRCSDKGGRPFIVEIQLLWCDVFNNRMVFDASKACVRRLDKKGPYHLPLPVYALIILNEEFYENTSEFYHHYRTVNCQNTDGVIHGLEFVMVELPKFKPEKWAGRRMAVLWLRFLTEVDENLSAVPADLKENADINRALGICEESTFTEAELAGYDKYWDIVRVEKTLIYESEIKGYTEGYAENYAKGYAEGYAENYAKGLAEGEAKGLAGVVLNCKRSAFSLEQIQAATGLGGDRIEEILRSHGIE